LCNKKQRVEDSFGAKFCGKELSISLTTTLAFFLSLSLSLSLSFAFVYCSLFITAWEPSQRAALGVGPTTSVPANFSSEKSEKKKNLWSGLYLQLNSNIS